MQTRHLLFCLLAGTALAACNREPPPTDTAPDTTAPAPAAATAPAYTFNDALTAADFAQLVKTLSSIELAGRGPGTSGARNTVDYHQSKFVPLGLPPGHDGTWVPGLATPHNPTPQ